MDDAIAILIPAYNESATIAAITNRCLSYLPHVIVLNDGSLDDTVEQVATTSAVVFSSQTNRGKGATLLKGFELAVERNYRGVITLDADGQHDPDDLPHFLALIQRYSHDIIIGARHKNRASAPRLRLFANKLADFFISCAARKRVRDTQSGYRYYPVSFLKKYISHSSITKRFGFEADILIAAMQAKLSVHYVDIASCYPVGARASHYRVSKDTWEIAKVVVRRMFK